MTFYDDEEIEENENLEEDQSEEDELAEGEQEENDAESDTNESENQSEETDDSSSKGTMKGNRHLHGNRQKQIKKINDMMKKQSTNKKGKESSSRPSKGQRKYIRQQKQNNRREGIESPNKKPGKSKGGGAAAQKRNLRNQQHERRMNPPPKRVDTRTAEEKAEAQRQRSAKKHQELSRKANNANKKVANTTVKAGAKAGASAASAGAGAGAAGGAGAAMGPCCGIVLIIAIIIFLLIGIVGFFQNMPDMITEKIYDWINTAFGRVQILFGANPEEVQINETDIVETANYLIDMGYDLTGYGFLAEIETENDRSENIIKQEEYYTILWSYEPGGLLESSTYYIQFDGKVLEVSKDFINYSIKGEYIGIGKDLEDQNNILKGTLFPTGGIIYTDTNREITIRVTTKSKDGQEIEREATKVLVRTLNDDFEKDENGIIESYTVMELDFIERFDYVESDYLKSYLVADYRTYLFNDGRRKKLDTTIFPCLFR